MQYDTIVNDACGFMSRRAAGGWKKPLSVSACRHTVHGGKGGDRVY